MDRINCLPDETICHILSFLPMKLSASTSVLSRRWRNLFLLTPNLLLDNDQEDDYSVVQSFIDFVDRVLDVPHNFPFRKVSIRSLVGINPSHIIRWISDVVERGVLNLHIDVNPDRVMISLPLEIFTSKTIVELKLGYLFIDTLPDNVSLPSLKTLYLDNSRFCNKKYGAFGKLLSACPVLEEVKVRSFGWLECCRTLSSSTLKKLTIKSIYYFGPWDMTINTPSLAYLEYTDSVAKEYTVLNLESLVEAKLGLHLLDGTSNPTNLIKGLRNAKVLELSTIDTSEIFYKFREVIPVFLNLSRLTITIDLRFKCWEYLTVLLKKSPNLHTLVIKGPLCADVNGLSLHADLCELEYGLPVKVLKINEYSGNARELEQIKPFLERLLRLELVKVRAHAIDNKDKYRITNDLLSLPRSPKCNIKIKFGEKTR